MRVLAALLVALTSLSIASSAAARDAPWPAAEDSLSAVTAWEWPIHPPTIVSPWVAPAHEYGPGHRGVDLGATVGSEVHSPAPGTVAFAGSVAGRDVVTIDHGDGLVTTLEPVEALVTVGALVAGGEVIGTVDVGGHTPEGAVHFGVRRDGAYINPMVLLGGIPRAVLLPCC